MTIGDISTYVSFRTGADTNSFTNAQRAICFTRWLHKIVTMILQAQDEWDFDDSNISATYPTATRPLVASQRDYAFSTALWALIGKEGGSAGANAAITPLKIRRVDVTYDGTNYYKAEPFDEGGTSLGLGNDTNTDQRFSKTSPKLDVRDNALWVYPLASAADVTAGAKIRLTLQRDVTDISSGDVSTGTLVPPFDKAFHIMLGLGASWDFASANNLVSKQDIAAELVDYEERLKRHYSSKQLDRKVVLTPAFVDYT